MSLIRPLLRLCAVGALYDNTIAEARCYDSDNSPLVDALTSDAKPYITIYTDEDNRIEIDGRAMFVSSRNLSLVVEMGVASAVEVPVEGSSPIRKVQIPNTDAGVELIVDILESEVFNGLFGDPQNAFAELIRRMVLRVIRIPTHRGGSATQGTRWAARQVIFVCDVISDPPPGVVLDEGHVVRDFLTVAEGHPAVGGAVEIIRAMVNENGAPDWRKVQAWLTMTRQGIGAVGLAPYIVPDEQPTQLGVVKVSDDDMQTDTSSEEIELEPEAEPQEPPIAPQR